MANTCLNKMYVNSSNKESRQQIHDFMNYWVNAVLEEIDECSFEYYFDSRWDFPKEAMQQMTDSIKDTKGLYIKVLSIEECNYYAAFNVFEDGVWVTK